MILTTLLILSTCFFLLGLYTDNEYLLHGEEALADTGLTERVIFLAGFPVQFLGGLAILACAVVTRTTEDVVVDWMGLWHTLVKAATGK